MDLDGRIDLEFILSGRNAGALAQEKLEADAVESDQPALRMDDDVPRAKGSRTTKPSLGQTVLWASRGESIWSIFETIKLELVQPKLRTDATEPGCALFDIEDTASEHASNRKVKKEFE